MQFLTLREREISPHTYLVWVHLSTFLEIICKKNILGHLTMAFASPALSYLPLTRSTESDDGRENGNEIVMKVMEMRERREGSIK